MILLPTLPHVELGALETLTAGVSASHHSKLQRLRDFLGDGDDVAEVAVQVHEVAKSVEELVLKARAKLQQRPDTSWMEKKKCWVGKWIEFWEEIVRIDLCASPSPCDLFDDKFLFTTVIRQDIIHILFEANRKMKLANMVSKPATTSSHLSMKL